MFTKIKRRLPWWTKIVAKLVLSRSPLSYSDWQKLALFRHGYMHDPGYALGVFDTHVTRSGIRENFHGKTILEIGPGDSIATTIISRSHDARAILVDIGPFATEDTLPYLALCELLGKQGLKPPEISSAHTLEDILLACDGEYLTEGLTSWKQVSSNSVDFIFSQAVLEHIPKEEFLPTMRECRRVMKPGSIASHTVDLRDHLGEALNNLRFSDGIWESNLFKSSGFYTNRIRYTEMLRMFESAGFLIEKIEVQRWDRLPTPREKLASPFREMSEDELRINVFGVCLRVPDLEEK